MRHFFLATALSALLLYGCAHRGDRETEFLRPALIQEIYFDIQDDPGLVEPERWPSHWAEGQEDRDAIIHEAVTIWIYRRGE